MSLLDGFEDALSSKASEGTQEFLTEHVTSEAMQFGMEVGVDSFFNAIPLIGTTITTYRNKKQTKNLLIFIKELDKRIDSIQTYIKSKNERDKEIIDEIVNTAVDKSLQCKQDEKIEFIVHGLESILKNDDISFDVASLYFDTIDRITLLDIAVLKFYRSPFNPETGEARDIQLILDTFNINLEILQATRSNLRTIGLLETKTDKKIADDIEKIYKSLSKLTERVNLISSAFKNPKKASKVRDSTIKVEKIQSKDSFMISKFGRDFHDYFIDENPFKND